MTKERVIPVETDEIEWDYLGGCWKPSGVSGIDKSRLAIVKEIDRFFVTFDGEWYGPFHHLDEAEEKGEELIGSDIPE